jgi:CRISP-associated protein Cas1
MHEDGAADLAGQHSERPNASGPDRGLSAPVPEADVPADKTGTAFQKALDALRREFRPATERAASGMPGGDTGGADVRTDEAVAEARLTKPEAPPSAPITAQPPAALEPIPARMLNEYVYCPRLFYYEHVEGVFVESADTLRGAAIHKRVDAGSGALPAAAVKSAKRKKSSERSEPEAASLEQAPGNAGQTANAGQGGDAAEKRVTAADAEPTGELETIHSRSVQLSSERLGVVAKIDLVEAKADKQDLLTALEVCPVDYKAGAPREGADANELWDTDKMQLGLQALLLRDNGYTCHEGVIYYRATKQRVRLPITAEIESWIEQQIALARQTARGPMPPPLTSSPKCVRCSLAPVCLPDETQMLSRAGEQSSGAAPSELRPDSASGECPPATGQEIQDKPRRLMAARDDTRPLYLNTQGFRVGCKEEVLQVKDKDKVVEEVRLRDLSHVALFGNIQISTQSIQALCEAEIPVTYFSMGGWFYGITRGHGLKNVFLRMEQFRLARSETDCLRLARQFVHGKIRNHRTLLMRNHLEAPAPVVLKLKRASDDALEAGSLEGLLGIEGAAASQYFQQFGGMLKIADELTDDPSVTPAAQQLAFNFNFTNRNRRPPTDPVNAMLSLAYSLLTKDCTLAVLAVGFDPYIGFYHQPRFGRPALALDLVEEFRPLVAESTVLTCINNRVITEKDFVRAGQAVNLSAPGRKRFFQVYEQRMSSLLNHPLFDYKVSYRRALELQARLLGKALTGEISDYVPLLTR